MWLPAWRYGCLCPDWLLVFGPAGAGLRLEERGLEHLVVPGTARPRADPRRGREGRQGEGPHAGSCRLASLRSRVSEAVGSVVFGGWWCRRCCMRWRWS